MEIGRNQISKQSDLARWDVENCADAAANPGGGPT